jgi:hypothetical protein
VYGGPLEQVEDRLAAFGPEPLGRRSVHILQGPVSRRTRGGRGRFSELLNAEQLHRLFKVAFFTEELVPFAPLRLLELLHLTGKKVFFACELFLFALQVAFPARERNRRIPNLVFRICPGAGCW